MKPLRLLSPVIAVAFILGGCSTSGSEESSDGVATLEEANDQAGDAAAAATLEDAEPEVTAEEAALEFSACMREEGLDFPDIGIDAEGNINLREGFAELRGQDGFRDAIAECQPLIADAGFGGGRRAALQENVELQDAFVAFSDCVREQGFDVGDLTLGPQPGAEGNGDGQQGGPGAGQGRAQGGFGNRNERFAEQLGLDVEDPAVEAALEVCSPIIDEAFSAAGIDLPGQPVGS